MKHELLKRFCLNMALLLLSVVVMTAVIEFLLANFWPQLIPDRQYHEQYHPVMGWVNKPNVKGSVGLNPLSGTQTFRRSHNSDGLRNLREFSHTKKEGVKRILLIGDSYFWGYGVDDDYVISEVLQKRIGERAEVINGAVTGYGTDQELLWLINEGLKYQPDIVILGFAPGSDVVEITSSISYGYPKPYYTYENGSLVPHNIPVPDTRQLRNRLFGEPDRPVDRLKSWLGRNLHIYRLITGRMYAVPAFRAFFQMTGPARHDREGMYADLPDYKLTDSEKIMDLSDALIREIRITSEKAGAGFMLMFQPNKEYEPGYPVGYGQMVGYGKDAYDIAANFPWNTSSSEYLQRMTRKEKMELLDLLPVVRAAHRRGEQFYYPGVEDHHWSEAGHRIAAEAIFERLDRLGWLK